MAENPRRRPPVVVIAIVVLALLGTAGYFWWRSMQPAGETELTASGAVEQREYQVAAVTAGSVTAVNVHEGDQVKKGQTIVKLDDAALKLAVQQANEGVTAANAAVTNARDDGTDADVSAALARLAQARANVSLAKVQLGYATVTCPHDGIVTSVTTNAGQNASPGKTLVTIADPADLYVRVFVPETEVGNVKLGKAAKATTDSSPKTFDGTVSYVSSQAEFTPTNVETKDQRVKLVYEVRVRVSDDSGTLKAGMPVDVKFG